ncbi:F390 synthetase-related protein [Paraburkholderia phenazinium]|jgi:putative adenylate-forming enzyme|uniref:Putative adenylate-forming enzyme n=1 Tax=Paraburkholderia phenazinium TaxID=60549 RepID=A0A1G8MFL4_9BURK|nr:F390 synthetase-related protein [Paraburkholderia phenazinium]SDI66662.1 putative adenylate-forming enzyme [Paraburkholderia phenazinium]
MRLPETLWSYWQTRRLRFASRVALEQYQQRRLSLFIQRHLTRSPWFAQYLSQPLQTWPLMNKAVMMEHFDRINTAGLKLTDVLACAMHAEHSRDFKATVNGYSVGLSTGTSGSRGVFVVSPQEQAKWAGVLLAKLLPRGLFHGERVALFLRANNNLYASVRNPWLSFEFFDLFEPFEAHFERLNRYDPTIVVGPAQVLRSLALARTAGHLTINPHKVISGAEVLDPLDKTLIGASLGTVGEVYQATEGFLAATCAHGTLHLNEAHIHVEPQWLDDTRFVPVITDFTRVTQPIVRYRLDDILVRRTTPCPCNSHEMALERIEGRCDDLLRLPAANGGAPVEVFADGLSRALAQTLPRSADYRLVQTGPASLALYVDAPGAPLAQHQTDLSAYLQRVGVAAARLQWELHDCLPAPDYSAKRRRITRRYETHS